MSLDILTDVMKVTLKDFEVLSSSYVTPTNTNATSGCFEQGQWFTIDSESTTTAKIRRCISSTDKVIFPVWSKKGEGSTQILNALAVIFAGSFEAETDQYEDGKTYTPGTALTVGIGEDSYGKLTPVTEATTQTTVAYVVLDPDSNSSKLRYVVR